MEIDDLLEKLNEMRNDENDFLVQLRANRVFDDVGFNQFLDYTTRYGDLIKNDSAIDKWVMADLYYTEIVMESMMASGYLDDLTLQKVNEAHTKIVTLIEQVLVWGPNKNFSSIRL